MAVLLSRGYQGYLAGTVVNLPTSIESSLIAQNMATAALVANTTTGPVTANVPSGICAIAIGQSSIVITNNLVDANTMVWAAVRQASADGTLLRIERVLPANGSFTIYGTGNAAAVVLVSWAIVGATGLSISN